MSPPVLEAEITPGMAASEAVELARLAEMAGFDRLGVSDVALWPDTFMLQALCAQATERIAVGAMVTNPYSRHPAVLAAALATLADVSGGRAFCGLGVGAGLEPLGIDYPRPVRTLGETVHVVRRLLAGEHVEFRGETVTVDGAALVRPPATPVPLSIGTRSRQVMELAGEVADIALVGGRYLSPALADQYHTWLATGAARAGRTLDDLEVAPRLTLCCSADGDLARRSVVRYVAHYLVLIRPDELAVDPDRLARMEAALARSTGWYFDNDRHDDPELADLVTDDLMSRFAVVGTPDECLEGLQAVADLGFTSLSLNLAAPRRATMFEGLAETITSVAPVLDRLEA